MIFQYTKHYWQTDLQLSDIPQVMPLQFFCINGNVSFFDAEFGC